MTYAADLMDASQHLVDDHYGEPAMVTKAVLLMEVIPTNGAHTIMLITNDLPNWTILGMLEFEAAGLRNNVEGDPGP